VLLAGRMVLGSLQLTFLPLDVFPEGGYTLPAASVKLHELDHLQLFTQIARH
jgi:hypothetical protein